MDKRKEVLDSLNNILQGEHMAINAYNMYITHLKEKEVIDEFQQIQEDHRKHAQDLAEHIQKLGDRPREKTGFKGVMADTMINMDLTVRDNPSHIIRRAYEGEDKGITMAEEVVKGDLDQESRKLIDKILTEDRKHLNKMKRLMEKYH